jgi:hypothetical protein
MVAQRRRSGRCHFPGGEGQWGGSYTAMMTMWWLTTRGRGGRALTMGRYPWQQLKRRGSAAMA